MRKLRLLFFLLLEFAEQGFLFETGGLDFFEGFEIFFAVAAETVFLEIEVLEIALVFEVDLDFEEMGRDGFGEFTTTDGEDAGFESGNAAEAPLGVDERLDERLFFEGDGLVVSDEDLAEFFVFGDVVSRQKNGLAGEGGFDGIMGDFGLAGFGLGSS